LLKHFEDKAAETLRREIKDLEIFSSCFNRTTKQSDDIILIMAKKRETNIPWPANI
jgi:hypothetical protein